MRPSGVGLLGDVVEVTFAVVAEEITAADGRDVDVGVAVVVVIADGHSLAVKRLIEAGLFGHILEMTLAIVAVESLGGRRRDHMAGPVGRIDEEQVLVAVAVIIEERHSAPMVSGSSFSPRARCSGRRRSQHPW